MDGKEKDGFPLKINLKQTKMDKLNKKKRCKRT